MRKGQGTKFSGLSALAIWSFAGGALHRSHGGPLFYPDGGEGGGGTAGGAAGAAGGAAGGAPAAGAAGEGNKEKLIPQSKVDEIVKERLKERDAQELKKNQQLLEDKNISDKRRAELEARNEELSTNLLSEKDKADKERTKLKQQFEAEIKARDEKTGFWKTKYQSTETRRQIRSAAQDYGAEEDQMMDMLGHKVQLVEEKNPTTGEPTGDFLLVIPYEEKSQDGKTTIKKQATIDEYMKMMMEGGKHANLFKSTRVAGSGTRPSSGGNKGGAPKNSKSPLDKISAGLATLK